MPGTNSTDRLRHPLAVLRTTAGYTHGEYARLIAKTHAELGFGQMAARREKVSRWEAGRAVPERTAQLAIAHIHEVPQDEVLRRTWPDWLHLANGDARQLDLPWTNSAVPDAILDATDGRRTTHQAYLLASGSATRSLMETWMAAMAENLDKAPAKPVRAPAKGPQHPPADTETSSTLEACTRLRTLHKFARKFSANWLVPANDLELRQLANHLRAFPQSLRSGQPMVTLAAEGLALCGFITRVHGDHANAQRYYVAALRCATATADAELAAAIVTLHAGQYLDLGLHKEANELLTAVKKLLCQPGVVVTDPALEALLHAQSARVHALRQDDVGRKRELLASRRALNTPATSGDLSVLPIRSEGWLQLMDATALLDMGRPELAIKQFEPVLTDQPMHLPPCARALYLLRASETQIALGEYAAGADSAEKAIALLGGMREAAAERVRLALRA